MTERSLPVVTKERGRGPLREVRDRIGPLHTDQLARVGRYALAMEERADVLEAMVRDLIEDFSVQAAGHYEEAMRLADNAEYAEASQEKIREDCCDTFVIRTRAVMHRILKDLSQGPPPRESDDG